MPTSLFLSGTRRCPSARAIALAACSAALGLGAASHAIAADPAYSVRPAGLYGPSYISTSGAVSESIFAMSQSGYLVGQTQRYSGNQTRGMDTWMTAAGGTVTHQIGLIGAGYETATGARSSPPIALTETDRAAGTSDRFGPSGALGRDAWVTSIGGISTFRVGLVGSGYESTTGSRASTVSFLNSDGHTMGVSLRYSGSAQRGQDAWLATPDGASTILVGLTGPDYLSSDGTRSSSSRFLSTTGLASGVTNRWNGSSGNGTDAWIATASGTTTQIGFFGPEHTQAGTNLRASEIVAANNLGQVAGYSSRYDGVTYLGTDAWITAPHSGVTTRVGLDGPDYTGPSGQRASGVSFLNDLGQSAGATNRYDATMQRGQDAWVRRADGVTLQIGLVGTEFERPATGDRVSRVTHAGASGYFGGDAQRYSPNGGSSGYSAWIADAATGITNRVGLSGPGYSASGFEWTLINRMSSAGHAAGTTDRFGANQADVLGKDAWVTSAGGGITRRAGLIGGDFESNGFRSSTIEYLNAIGQSVGFSRRMTSAGGEAAWFYDPLLDTSRELTFSTRADGYTYTIPRVLTDTGVVLGSYNSYDGMTLLGPRAFWWKLDTGFHDLGDLVEGGIDAAGWLSLINAMSAAGSDPNGFPYAIAGAGTRIGESSGFRVFLLNAVPVPGTGVLLGLCVTTAIRRSRR